MAYLCPVCKSELKWGGSARYQTTDEHVTRPNAESPERSFYYCDNDCCDANAPEESDSRTVLTEKFEKTDPNSIGIFWDRDGGLYGWSREIKFIDGNNAPFGSHERRINIEVYKKDENFTFITALGFKLHIEFSYEADTDGNILNRKRNLRIWRKRRDGGYTLVIGTWRMIKFHNRQFLNMRNSFMKSNSEFARRELEQFFRPKRYRRPSSFIFSLYAKIFYPILNMRVKNVDQNN